MVTLKAVLHMTYGKYGSMIKKMQKEEFFTVPKDLQAHHH